jgi:hypothetical protein
VSRIPIGRGALPYLDNCWCYDLEWLWQYQFFCDTKTKSLIATIRKTRKKIQEPDKKAEETEERNLKKEPEEKTQPLRLTLDWHCQVMIAKSSVRHCMDQGAHDFYFPLLSLLRFHSVLLRWHRMAQTPKLGWDPDEQGQVFFYLCHCPHHF